MNNISSNLLLKYITKIPLIGKEGKEGAKEGRKN
jgi:hypothetical protein